MNNNILIDFYQKPKLCCRPLHTIDLMSVTDKYNPFASSNWYASINSIISEEFYEKIIDLVIHTDLMLSRQDEIDKSISLSNSVFFFLKEEMEKNNIEFKMSSKYFLQSAFAKIYLKTMYDDIQLFFQLLGVKKKRIAHLTNVSFIKFIVLHH